MGNSYGGVRGEQIKSDTSRHGVVDDGNVAWGGRNGSSRHGEAGRKPTPATSSKVGKRTYIDKATGTEYVAARGAVMLNVGREQDRGINCFFIESGRLIFLHRPEFEEPLHGPTGHVYSQQVSAVTPGPSGPRIL